MKDNLILKLVDSSSKECEVTGEMMGGRDEYEIPVSKLKPGLLKWPQGGDPDHSINIIAVGKDFVKLSVRDVAGTWEEYTLHLGETAASDYMFGEWSYSYRVTLETATDEKMENFGPEGALQEAEESEKKLKRADGKLDYDAYNKTKELYEKAAVLGSEKAYVWLVKQALTYVKTYRGEQLWTFHAYESHARELVDEAESKGIGAKAREIYEARPDYIIEDGVLCDMLRKTRPVIIPDGVTTLEEYSFSRCNIFNDIAGGRIIIPASVTTIETRAFMDNRLITQVEILGPAVIGKYAFRGNPKLKKFIVNKNAKFEEKEIFDDPKKVEVVYIETNK